MTSRTLWIPAENLNIARQIAYAVDAGRLPMMPHYATEEAAEIRAAILAETHARSIPVFAIVIEKRVTHDGVIPVATLADRAGDAAAAFTLFALIPLVGFASLWERLA